MCLHGSENIIHVNNSKNNVLANEWVHADKSIKSGHTFPESMTSHVHVNGLFISTPISLKIDFGYDFGQAVFGYFFLLSALEGYLKQISNANYCLH